MTQAELIAQAKERAEILMSLLFAGEDVDYPPKDANVQMMRNLYADEPIYFQAWATWATLQCVD